MVYQISLEDRQMGLLEEHVIAKLKHYRNLLNDEQFVCGKPFSAVAALKELNQYIGMRDELLKVDCSFKYTLPKELSGDIRILKV